MQANNVKISIDLRHQLSLLDEHLLALLKSLTPEEWQLQTIAKLWKVKDVVAHLLDGNIRILSALRDQYQTDNPEINSYQDLVDYLNQLNADWVQAFRRVSPNMLILLHEITGKPFCEYYATLDPFARAAFPVAWAGESESKNWMHIAREYTEKFLHQQQIRDAVNRPGIMTKEFFLPFAEICMLALPHTFRKVQAAEQTIVQFTILGEIGSSWYLTKEDKAWVLQKNIQASPESIVEIDANAFWKLVSKSKRYEDIRDQVTISGNPDFAEKALTMVSFMA